MAPTVSISPVHRAECHEEMVVSGGLDAWSVADEKARKLREAADSLAPPKSD